MAGSVITAVLSLKDKDFTSNAKKANKQLTETERKTQYAKNQVTKFENSAKKGMKNIAKGVGIASAAFAALGGATFAATKKVADNLYEISGSADKLGITTDSLQEMTYWAEQNGLSTSQMEKGLGRLNQRIGRAADGNEKYSSALENLGVDMNKVRDGTVSTEDAFSQSIKTLSEMENSQDQSAAASELFGTKLSRDLMPALQDGSLSLEDAKEKANELGIIVGEDSIDSAGEFMKSWEQMKSTVKSFGTKALAGVMPFFQGVMDWSIDKIPVVKQSLKEGFEAAQPAIDWLKNEGLAGLQSVLGEVKSVASDAFEGAKPTLEWMKDDGLPKVTDFVGEVLDKATDLYNFFKDNWSLIGPVVAGIAASMLTYKVAITAVSTAQKIWQGVTTVLTVAQGALNAVMAANPIGIIVIAIGALVAAGIALYKNWDTVKEYASSLWDKMKQLGGWLKETFVSIFGAVIRKGQELWEKMGGLKGVALKLLGPFGQVVEAGIFVYKNWDTIKEKASEMGIFVKDKIIDMKEKVVGKFIDMKDSAIDKFKDIVSWAKKLPGKIGQGIVDYISDATSGMKKLATGLIDKFKESLGIKSPSTVFFDMAKWIVKGLANGLSAGNLKSLGTNLFKDFAGGAFDTIGSIKDFITGGGAGSGGKPAFEWGVSSPFGMRKHPNSGVNRLHGGTDFAAPMGSPIPSQSGGKVTHAGRMGGFGNLVIVKQGQWERYYAHMSSIGAAVGDTVKKGDSLGLVGSTGDSTGPHLHYEMRKNGQRVDPMGQKEQGGRISRTGSYLVGEAGPEMVSLQSGSKVHNAQNTRKQSGGINEITININARDKTVSEIINELVPALKMRLANL